MGHFTFKCRYSVDMGLSNGMRYYVSGLVTLFAAIAYHYIPDQGVVGVPHEALKGFMMFLVAIFGAVFGVSLALLWKERDA